MSVEFYVDILERRLARSRPAHKVWRLTVQAIYSSWTRAARASTAPLLPTSSINSLTRERGAPLHQGWRSVKALRVSPCSHRRLPNEMVGRQVCRSEARGGS